jgi:hypothetical protein
MFAAGLSGSPLHVVKGRVKPRAPAKQTHGRARGSRKIPTRLSRCQRTDYEILVRHFDLLQDRSIFFLMCSAVTPTGWGWLDVDDALALRPALRSFPPNLWIKKSASVFLLLIAATSKRALASRPAKARLAFADHGTPSQMVVDGKCDHAPGILTPTPVSASMPSEASWKRSNFRHQEHQSYGDYHGNANL